MCRNKFKNVKQLFFLTWNKQSLQKVFFVNPKVQIFPLNKTQHWTRTSDLHGIWIKRKFRKNSFRFYLSSSQCQQHFAMTRSFQMCRLKPCGHGLSLKAFLARCEHEQQKVQLFDTNQKSCLSRAFRKELRLRKIYIFSTGQNIDQENKLRPNQMWRCGDQLLAHAIFFFSSWQKLENCFQSWLLLLKPTISSVGSTVTEINFHQEASSITCYHKTPPFLGGKRCHIFSRGRGSFLLVVGDGCDHNHGGEPHHKAWGVPSHEEFISTPLHRKKIRVQCGWQQTSNLHSKERFLKGESWLKERLFNEVQTCWVFGQQVGNRCHTSYLQIIWDLFPSFLTGIVSPNTASAEQKFSWQN